MKSRTPFKLKENVPGPGYYKISDNINKSGKYFNSKHKNCSAVNFKNRKKNLKNINNFIDYKFYENPIKINNNGKYFVSRIENIKTPKIILPNKFNFKNNSNHEPGPGSYLLPSEFGVYISSKIKH